MAKDIQLNLRIAIYSLPFSTNDSYETKNAAHRKTGGVDISF
jgi:hypothetical protein